MRKVNIICLSFMFIFMNTFAWAITEVEDKNDWMAQNFIANQIKGIGLVDSYQEDESNVSYVYDNALAAIACMAAGNFGLAKEILDTLSSEVKTTSEVFSQSYYYSDTSGEALELLTREIPPGYFRLSIFIRNSAPAGYITRCKRN